jgi:uncharacterized membrane protein
MKDNVKRIIGDKDTQQIIGTLLRVGVLLAMAVVLIGGVLYIISDGAAHTDYSTFVPGNSDLTSFSSILSGLLHFDGKAIIQCGILLLIFTPVSRVILSIVSFFLERDYLYVVIGLVVLTIILFSLSNKLVG